MSRAAVLASGRGRRQAFGGVLGVHRFFDQCRADPAFTTHDVSNHQDWDWVNWIWTSYSEASTHLGFAAAYASVFDSCSTSVRLVFDRAGSPPSRVPPHPVVFDSCSTRVRHGWPCLRHGVVA